MESNSLIYARQLGQLALSIFPAVLVCQMLQTSGLETVLVVLSAVVLALDGSKIRGLSTMLFIAFGTSLFVVGLSTTLLEQTVGSSLIGLSALIGTGGSLFAQRARGDSCPADSRPNSLFFVPSVFLSLSLLLFVDRFRHIGDSNSRWWLLTQTSEDNAAWLNMFGRAAVKTSISPPDISNLGHTLPTLMWFIRRVGDLLPGRSILTSPIEDASAMAGAILAMEALMISACVFLSAAIVARLCNRSSILSGRLVGLVLAAPASLASLLGGLVLAKTGYLSALAAVIGLQVLSLLLVSDYNGRIQLVWISLACLATGLSWFPIIPIVALGLSAAVIDHLRNHQSRRVSQLCQAGFGTFCIVILADHLRQLLSRYPDVDRLQGSMWIGSQYLLTFFIILSIVAVVVIDANESLDLRQKLLTGLGVCFGWLALVWVNDAVRTGGPGHYGTTKLTFVVQYGLFPLVLAVALLGGARRFRLPSPVLSYVIVSSLSCIAISGVANDFNNRWPRKPSEEEVAQNAIIGILPLISKASEATPSSVVCLFVGDFEATGNWKGSYPCTRWGSSLSGIDGPPNEAFRQVILGNADGQLVIPGLISDGFFDDSVIVTDNPERLKAINPWGVVTAAEESRSRVVVFRPQPKFLRWAKVVAAK